MRSLVLLLDTVRRDFLTCYGNDWVQTPNIDRLAGRSVIHDQHYVGSLPCMPARRDMITGRLEMFHRGWSGLEPYDRTLPALLRDGAGVHSHMATDHYHYFHLGGENYVDAFSTWDFQRGQEGDKWVSLVDKPSLPDFKYNSRLSVQNMMNRMRQQAEEDYSGPRTVMGAVDWLQHNAKQDDWFLQLELFDPHEPFYAPDDYLRMYGIDDEVGGIPYDWPQYMECGEPPEVIDNMRRRYAALLTMTDRWIGRVLDELERQGVYDDTMIIFTTDHGTHLGDHGYWMKNYMPVRQCLAHLPLLVKHPQGAGAGERCAALTQTPDLFRTLCRHHGVDTPHDHGVGFQEAYAGERQHEAVVYGYFGQSANVTDGRYSYFRNSVNEENGPLYHYFSQPQMGLFHNEELRSQVEQGFRFDFSGALPLSRIPVHNGMGQHRREAGGVGKHQLFDLSIDDEQHAQIDDPAVEARLAAALKGVMEGLEAPEEQFVRLGL
ncbi:MAG: sulfatase [Planctomycetota bacterium]|jgi:arylsulfatase A-like enzyme|nr:sulfatase [Planctomycetota bacterium]